MRGRVLLVALALGLGCTLSGEEQANNVDCILDAPPPVAAVAVNFTTQIQPILVARCTPCHFPGGIMYERLPFDQPKTIRSLGEKLFTRIKDENERGLIREFLAQQL